MERKRHKPEQIVAILREAERGGTTALTRGCGVRALWYISLCPWECDSPALGRVRQ